eukprot:271526-Rhodomonas_salina.1
MQREVSRRKWNDRFERPSEEKRLRLGKKAVALSASLCFPSSCDVCVHSCWYKDRKFLVTEVTSVTEEWRENPQASMQREGIPCMEGLCNCSVIQGWIKDSSLKQSMVWLMMW